MALYVKNSLPCIEIPINNVNSLEVHAIKLENYLIIVALYAPPKSEILKTDLQQILNLGNKVIAAGDLNAKHLSWNCYYSNKNGNTIFDYIERNPLILEYPNSFTLYPHNLKARPSIVDLAIFKNITNQHTIEALHELNSDHKPVLMVFTSNKINNQTSSSPQYFNYQNADWKTFKNALNNKIKITPTLESIESIDTSIDELTQTISDAIAQSIPTKKPFENKYELPKHILNQIQNRNSLRKIYQKTRNAALKPLVNESTRKIKESILNHRNKQWENKLSSLTPKDNSLWKMVKTLKGQNKTHIPPLKDSNGTLFQEKDKAEVLAKHFQSVHSLTENMGTREHNQYTNQTYLNTINLQHKTDSVKLATPKEIKRAIMKTKSKKAPGIDGIQNIVLKYLPKKAIVQITYIFNACLKQGYFPSGWKKAKILPIHKPGKDKTLPQSYRPISLLNTLSKLLEAIILNRLHKHELEHKQLIPEQFGFRSKHWTVQQLARLTDSVSLNFNINKSTCALFLDMEKAFDTVWHEGLITKLKNCNIDQYLIKIINSYLKNRTFVVGINNNVSTEKSVAAGVPQGSVLGPVLFLYYVNDIPKSTKVQIAIFADDTALFALSWHKKQAIKELQTYVHELEQYYYKWKLKINTSKTELVLFSRKFREKEIPKITLYNQCVQI